MQEANKSPKQRDEEMMDALITAGREGADATVKPGWSRLTALTLQFIHPKGTGYGFVTWVNNEWTYVIAPNGQAQIKGTAAILQTATSKIESVLSEMSHS